MLRILLFIYYLKLLLKWTREYLLFQTLSFAQKPFCKKFQYFECKYFLKRQIGRRTYIVFFCTHALFVFPSPSKLWTSRDGERNWMGRVLPLLNVEGKCKLILEGFLCIDWNNPAESFVYPCESHSLLLRHNRLLRISGYLSVFVATLPRIVVSSSQP